MTTLHVERWNAWAPKLEDAGAWRDWAQAPQRLDDEGEQPACAFLPTMQRRRLSRLARMTLHAAWPLCGEDEQLPLVFASRHGETPRTFELLGELEDAQPLSPTRFGLSVHNAIAGQWSILRGQRAESVAIAGEADTFEHAVLEAAILLAAGAPSVLLAIAEERPPEAYARWIDDVPFSYAVALRLGRGAVGDGTDWDLQLDAARDDADRPGWPHALSFLRALLSEAPSLEHVWKTRRWTWQRIR